MYVDAFDLEWHKPDNTANLFTAVSCENDPHVYRLSIELTDDINPELLQKALEDTLPYFRALDVRYIQKAFSGMFKVQDIKPEIEPDTKIICRYFKWEEDFLFRVLYGKKNIHLEASHALTDGTGGFYFLKAIAYRYIQIANQKDLPKEYREKRFGLEKGMNIIDGYFKNYRKVKSKEHRPSKAWQFPGERRVVGDIGLMSLEMSVQELKKASKWYDSTISEYLSVMLLKSAIDSYTESINAPIRIELPVNLRPIFQTETALNFFSNIGIDLLPKQFSFSFDEMICVVKSQFTKKIKKERFEEQFSLCVRGENSLVAQIVPLKVRDCFLRFMYKLCSGRNTLGFSNMGKVEIDPIFSTYISSISAMASPTPDVPVKIVACSVNDRLRMNITTGLCDMVYLENIVKALMGQGIHVKIVEGNFFDRANYRQTDLRYYASVD